jgi:hypothetical protein
VKSRCDTGGKKRREFSVAFIKHRERAQSGRERCSGNRGGNKIALLLPTEEIFFLNSRRKADSPGDDMRSERVSQTLNTNIRKRSAVPETAGNSIPLLTFPDNAVLSVAQTKK